MASEITMIPCTNQKALGQDLMDEIRAVYDSEKYGHITRKERHEPRPKTTHYVVLCLFLSISSRKHSYMVTARKLKKAP